MGLLNEIIEMRKIAQNIYRGAGRYSEGIFQAIGYKEFEGYLDHLEQAAACKAGNSEADFLHVAAANALYPHERDETVRALFQQGLDAMKGGTRQYARRQMAWLRHKLLPEIKRQRQRGTRTASLRLDMSGT